jgi:hypothetical protein
LLERMRAAGAHWAVIALAGMMTLLGFVSVGVAAVRDEPDQPNEPARTQRPKRRFPPRR